MSWPSLELEAQLLASAPLVVGVDEVGRGAIAGPVAVGAVVIRSLTPAPDGLRDSKLLSEPRREAMAPLAAAWCERSAVGLASAAEIDRLGIVRCLHLAAERALAELGELGGAVVILDGSHDWLSPIPQARVQSRVKADRDCASVAAASVIAKVHRDRLMIEADAAHPGYGWARNKGYGSAAHFAAIAELGPSQLHRRSWLRASSA